MRGRSLIYWSVLLLILGLLVLVPRGPTNTQGKIELTEGGTPSVKFSAGSSILSKAFLSKLEKRYRPEIYSEAYSKRDYFLVVYHKYHIKMDLSQVEEAELKALDLNLPGLLTITVPGEVTKTNAPRVSGKTAIWTLSLGKTREMEISSRYIRWWAIILLSASLLILVYLRVSFRKRV